MEAIRRTALAALLLVLSGCAVNQAALPTVDMPVCTAGKDCELKWAIARRWLLNHSGFKIQTVADDFIETFNSRDYASPLPWVRIVREPLDTERYRISLEVGCNNMFGCVPDARELVADFTSTMARGVIPEVLPPPLPPPPKPVGNPNAR